MTLRKIYLNAKAIRHNLQRVRYYAPQSKVMAMVKSHGYGHGLLFAANALVQAGVDALAVGALEEALALREAGIQKSIMLISGCQHLDDLKVAQQNNIGIVIHQAEQIADLKQLSASQPVWTWIKINTGMNRLGLRPENLLVVWQELNALKVVQKPIGIVTHFANADQLNNPVTLQQFQVFTAACTSLPPDAQVEKTLANSAAILSCPTMHSDWVRPGIMLYGSSPFPDKSIVDFGLMPVMTAVSEITAIYNCEVGDAVGYGGMFVCQRPSRIAIVAFGYGDGYPRNASGAFVLIKGHRVPVVGRVSMDMLTVDITDFPDIHYGDEVILWGEGLPIDELAYAAQTISYEIFCRMPMRRAQIIIVD